MLLNKMYSLILKNSKNNRITKNTQLEFLGYSRIIITQKKILRNELICSKKGKTCFKKYVYKLKYDRHNVCDF